MMKREETAVPAPENPARLYPDRLKFGYSYEVICPQCGFRFSSWPKTSDSRH
jgi:hypothetical protein